MCEVIDRPFECDEQATFKFHDIQPVDEQPGKPRDGAGKMQRTNFSHGVVSSNGGEAAFIPVAKWLRFFVSQTGFDSTGGGKTLPDVAAQLEEAEVGQDRDTPGQAGAAPAPGGRGVCRVPDSR